MSNIDEEVKEVRPETQKAIEFFERVSKKFPRLEDGSLDDGKLNYHFIESLDDSPEADFIRSKLPEAYLRGRRVYEPLYDFFYRKSDDGKTSDEQLFRKLANCDFSDMRAIDEKIPVFLTFAKVASEVLSEYVNLDYYNETADILERLWRENKVLPQSMQEEVERYRDIYDKIGTPSSFYIGTKNVEYELNDASEEQKPALKFKLKIAKIFEAARDDRIDRPSDSRMNELQQKKKTIEDKLDELAKTHNKMIEELEQSVNESFIDRAKRFLGKNQDEQDPDSPTLDQIEQQIAKEQKYLLFATEDIRIAEEEREIADNINKGYCEIIYNEILPKIKERLKRCLNQSDMEAMFSYFFSEENLSKEKPADALVNVSKALMPAARMTKADYDFIFKSALMHISGLADSFLKYENNDEKNLVKATNIARATLINIPPLRDEKELSKRFRSVEPAIYNNFTKHAPLGHGIVSCLDSYIRKYKNNRNVEDLDEYIKNAGDIWYDFMHVFPYEDGNARTANYLLNIMLAERGIVMSSLYTTTREKAELLARLDENGLKIDNREKFCDDFLAVVKEKGFDLTGQNRLRPNTNGEILESQLQESQNEEWHPTQP